MTQYIYILMLFTKVSGELELVEAELRLDPVTCMMRAQVINSGAEDESARIAACMPVLWGEDSD
jgi:hypothetical protein